ncbi:DUF485 domain-containing protein [Streptomyces sp. GbtcB7]|uniref:DUF485 domain-containing protein n=1 Tax=Streptomyces sp. GbtcB7 TaxID=2824752 RepID=UPI001C301CAB|nr:DUF485 domain-containing protein [Streptomyces sp. GbtcB7]
MQDAFSSPEHQRRHQPPYDPLHPPPHSSPHPSPHPFPHHTSPAHLTYPWQPQPQPPEPERKRQPRHPALGRHSDIRVLRGAYRRQRRVATLTALGYFTLFLILSAFAPGLMASEVSGGLPTGLLLGLLQVPVTCLAIGLYEYTARRRVDPIADRIRRQTQLDAKREAAR